jgi:hypothetical protein
MCYLQTGKTLESRVIPRLSKAGMPSRSEGWGGAKREPDRAKPKYLFKVAKHPFRHPRSAPNNKERFAIF